MKRAMQLPSLLMWRAVRDSKPDGLGLDALVAAARVPACNAQFRLKYLCSRGHLKLHRNSDAVSDVVWHLGKTLPTGESWTPGGAKVATDAATQAAAAAEEREDDEADKFAPRNTVPRGVPPGVSPSVWALGSMVAQEVAACADSAADTAKAPVAVAAPAPAAGDLSTWRAPVATELLAPVNLKQKSVAAPSPRFALRSDNVLVIDLAGDDSAPIHLPLEATRALFRWLDRLCGIELHGITKKAAA